MGAPTCLVMSLPGGWLKSAGALEVTRSRSSANCEMKLPRAGFAFTRPVCERAWMMEARISPDGSRSRHPAESVLIRLFFRWW